MEGTDESTEHRTLNAGGGGRGSFTEWQVSNLTFLDSTVLLHTNSIIFVSLIKSNQVELETVGTVIHPSTYIECSLHLTYGGPTKP